MRGGVELMPIWKHSSEVAYVVAASLGTGMMSSSQQGQSRGSLQNVDEFSIYYNHCFPVQYHLLFHFSLTL